MRAHTITTINRRRRNARRRRALGLAVGICAMAIPATASAQPTDSAGNHSSANSIVGSSESSQPAGSGDYSSVSSIAPPASESSGPGTPVSAHRVDPSYSSLNAISASPAEAPTFVSSSPSSGEGFDWPSALVGAGTALALAALGTAALLTIRRRSTVTPSPSTS